MATGCGTGLPVPVRLTVCALPLALSTIVRVPVALPFTMGWNVTLMVQFVAAGNTAGQLFVCANGWLAVMLEMFRPALPVFVNATGCEALVVPTSRGEKLRLAGDRATAGAGVNPVPLRET